MTEADERIRRFLSDEASRVTATAPSLSEAAATLAPSLGGRSTGVSRGMAVLFAAALLLVALTATIAIGSGVVRVPKVVDRAPTTTLSAERTDAVVRQVAALNRRDAEAFVAEYAADAAFDPRGTFEASSSLYANTLPIADRALVEPFMAINEAWGFEAELMSCEQLDRADFIRRYGLHHDRSDSFGHCVVRSRWSRLSLEIGEWWAYEFAGTEVLWWTQHVRDATPTAGELTLGLDGLLDWESWLRSTDPEAASRLLNPRVFPVVVPCGAQPVFTDESHTALASPEPACEWSSDADVDRIVSSRRYGRAEDDWTFAGARFAPNALVPYDPALASEIEASIEEFLLR